MVPKVISGSEYSEPNQEQALCTLKEKVLYVFSGIMMYKQDYEAAGSKGDL